MAITNPLISIIIPVYGVEDYLTECIDSIVRQLDTDIEVILIDDGSPDKCPKICYKGEKVYERAYEIEHNNTSI